MKHRAKKKEVVFKIPLGLIQQHIEPGDLLRRVLELVGVSVDPLWHEEAGDQGTSSRPLSQEDLEALGPVYPGRIIDDRVVISIAIKGKAGKERPRILTIPLQHVTLTLPSKR